MDQVVKYVVLGLLQGATEFFPISSSGHLVAAKELLGLEAPGLLVVVCLHFGTLLAIVIVFRGSIRRLAADGVKGLWLVAQGQGRAAIATRAPMFPMAIAVLVGSIPAIVTGLWLHDPIQSLFGNLRLSGVLLVCTGLVLIASRYAPPPDKTTIGPLRGLLVGLAQALALLPGISRSGSTIVTGYFLGVERELAARFSFLLALPTLAGAVAFEAAQLVSGRSDPTALAPGEWFALACGTATAALVGWLCLLVLFGVVRKGKLHWFAAYCVPVGALLFALSLLR